MPRYPTRYYGSGDLHFIIACCYRRRSFLGMPPRRDLLLDGQLLKKDAYNRAVFEFRKKIPVRIVYVNQTSFLRSNAFRLS
jgi:REP element-mobilizing transposase RayT